MHNKQLRNNVCAWANKGHLYKSGKIHRDECWKRVHESFLIMINSCTENVLIMINLSTESSMHDTHSGESIFFKRAPIYHLGSDYCKCKSGNYPCITIFLDIVASFVQVPSPN